VGLRARQIQTVQWDEGGGFKINFKAFAIGGPADPVNRCGSVGPLPHPGLIPAWV
jgi:hypothetical protein